MRQLCLKTAMVIMMGLMCSLGVTSQAQAVLLYEWNFTNSGHLLAGVWPG